MGNNNNVKINNDEYSILRIIGRGGFSIIYLIKYNKNIYALKEISKLNIAKKNMFRNIVNECYVLNNNNNPFLLKNIKYFENYENYYFLFKFLCGGDLRLHLKMKIIFNEKLVKFYTFCLINALEDFHNNNIIHQDIKPENICLDYKGYPFLIDYGVSKPIKNNKFPNAGTWGYFSPEYWLKKKIDKYSDYFSLGIVLYELLTGFLPYKGNRQNIKDKIFFEKIKLNGIFTDNCKKFVNGLLEIKAKKRLGYLGIWQIKSHPWLHDLNFDNIMNKKYIPDFIPPFISKDLIKKDKKLNLEEVKNLEKINKNFNLLNN